MQKQAQNNQDVDLYFLQNIRNDDEQALNALIVKYTPMVKKIIRSFYPGFLETEDLMQEGLIGLLSAIREYKEKNFQMKFSSFAYMCILRKICNVVKSMKSKKKRPENHLLSLNAYVQEGDNKTLLDTLVDGRVNPEGLIENIWIRDHVLAVLRCHLSALEFRVVLLISQGYGLNEIAEKMGLRTKSVDNARTRAKLKLKNMLVQYGSLLDPQLLRVAK